MSVSKQSYQSVDPNTEQVPNEMSQLSTLQTLSKGQLKKLYWRGYGLIFFSLLFAIMAVGCLFMLVCALLALLNHEIIIAGTTVIGRKDAMAALIVAPLSAVAFLLFAYGSFLGIQAVRIILIALFIICIFGGPLGKIIGILGLVTYFNTKLLFGKKRLARQDVAMELERRRLSS
jgi:hypothetical protein